MSRWKLPFYSRAAKKESAKIDAVFEELISSDDNPNLDKYVDMMNARELACQDMIRKDILREKIKKNIYAGGLVVSGVAMTGVYFNEPDQMLGLRIITVMGAAGLFLGGIGLSAVADYDANNIPDFQHFDDEPTE